MPMPNRAITYLSISCGVLLTAYVALVAVTIYFATMRTELTSALRDLESNVSALETDYYGAISKLDAIDVTSAGFVTPLKVGYIAENGTPTFTRADR